ncbi:Cbp1 family collagen-binding glycoprotein adhesin [Roseivirga misakiensis]|uniref:Uncharacterized protein n=1 Tax=Roseivirga misakiensis TaxID=1563681 RepID=A0A1E5T750_9BACT|nr:hypothetical protein [Roseivirga misakiensis]OEK07178.1 hypothetical protein BFP71_05855 [Roseivirga misakiensis]
MKQTMKIGMVLLGALTIAMWFTVSATSKKKEVLEERYVNLEKEIVKKESAFEEVMSLIIEVEEQITSIVEKENLVFGQRQEPFNEGKKESIMREIAMIDDLIVRSNENVKTLTDKIKSAEIKQGVFQKRLQTLQADLKARQTTIIDLKSELVAREAVITGLNSQKDSLNVTVLAQADAIEQKDLEVSQLTALNDELNKGYLAIGTFQDLKAKGVVDKEGGFLGLIGRKVMLQEDADKAEFLELDKRSVNQLKIEAASLSLVSDHPSSSYAILPGESDGIKILEITDPESFWQISKYLVISKNSRASR